MSPLTKGVLCNPRADRHTDTKVNTEDTLSGFQEYFLQPIIKAQPNILTKDHSYIIIVH